ncbi:hypothetical protein [Pedobacter sp. GR22-6]|uniref:hypothetical protein n=1 Tax=Pedobacter sp. GR22-6 TaxID=3127957 RepID=UPI00307E06BC
MTSQRIRNLASRIGFILSAMLITSFMAIYNGYPLFFNHDSAVYIFQGLRSENLPDRPILYAVFIFFIGRMYSLWFIVIFQSFAMSFIIFLYFKYLSPPKGLGARYLSFVAFASLFTSLSFEASWIMPDFFSSICALCVGLILFTPKMNRFDSIIAHGSIVLSVGMHNSHFYIFLACILIFICLKVFKSVRRDYAKLQIQSAKLLVLLLTIFVGNIFLIGVQYFYTGYSKGPRGGDAFLFSNLVEMGIMDEYLDHACPLEKYSICKYKDSLPNNFLWDSKSPINKGKGWEENIDEYSVINRKIIFSKFFIKVIYKSSIYSIKQIFNNDMSDNVQHGEYVIQAVKTMFPRDIPDHEKSSQYHGNLNIGFVNYSQIVIFGFCFSLNILSLLYFPLPIAQRYLLIYFCVVLIVNAALCGSLSGVFPRYQARVAWILPLPLFLFMNLNSRARSIHSKLFTLTK